MQSPQIAARSPTPSPSPTRGEGSQISFWCEIPPLPLWERGQGERGFTDFASALAGGRRCWEQNAEGGMLVGSIKVRDLS